MTSAVLTGVGWIDHRPVPVPTPTGTQLLVRVLATGICGSDLATFRGTHPYKVPPAVLGHELCGVVETAAADFRVGDLVCAAAYAHCDDCLECTAGRTNLCRDKRNLSHLGWDGSFAEYVMLESTMTYRLPAGLDPVLGALVEPLSIGLHAVRLLGAAAGRSLRVIGAGNIGLACVVAARRLGFGRIVTSDLGTAKGERACRVGADGHLDVAAGATDTSPADAVVVASGHPGAVDEALAAVRPGGVVVVVSFFAGSPPLAANLLVGREITLIGSSLSTPADFHEVISWLARGETDPMPMVTHRWPLSAAQQAMQAMAGGVEDIGKIILLPGHADGISSPGTAG